MPPKAPFWEVKSLSDADGVFTGPKFGEDDGLVLPFAVGGTPVAMARTCFTIPRSCSTKSSPSEPRFDEEEFSSVAEDSVAGMIPDISLCCSSSSPPHAGATAWLPSWPLKLETIDVIWILTPACHV